MKNVKNMVQIVILAALSLMLQQIATKTMKNGFDRECHCVFLCISLSRLISLNFIWICFCQKPFVVMELKFQDQTNCLWHIFTFLNEIFRMYPQLKLEEDDSEKKRDLLLYSNHVFIPPYFVFIILLCTIKLRIRVITTIVNVMKMA